MVGERTTDAVTKEQRGEQLRAAGFFDRPRADAVTLAVLEAQWPAI